MNFNFGKPNKFAVRDDKAKNMERDIPHLTEIDQSVASARFTTEKPGCITAIAAER